MLCPSIWNTKFASQAMLIKRNRYLIGSLRGKVKCGNQIHTVYRNPLWPLQGHQMYLPNWAFFVNDIQDQLERCTYTPSPLKRLESGVLRTVEYQSNRRRTIKTYGRVNVSAKEWYQSNRLRTVDSGTFHAQRQLTYTLEWLQIDWPSSTSYSDAWGSLSS